MTTASRTAGCCVEYRFDLPQLDADAAEFYLLVKTAHILEIAIRPIAD